MTMLDLDRIRELGRESRRRQGLPDKIQDVTVLNQAAVLYRQYLDEVRAPGGEAA